MSTVQNFESFFQTHPWRSDFIHFPTRRFPSPCLLFHFSGCKLRLWSKLLFLFSRFLVLGPLTHRNREMNVWFPGWPSKACSPQRILNNTLTREPCVFMSPCRLAVGNMTREKRFLFSPGVFPKAMAVTDSMALLNADRQRRQGSRQCHNLIPPKSRNPSDAVWITSWNSVTVMFAITVPWIQRVKQQQTDNIF